MAGSAAAIGCRSHSGWAVLVAVAGSRAAPLVVERSRVELTDGSLPVQPYHAAAESGLSRVEAAELVLHVEEVAATRAGAALAELVLKLSLSGRAMAGAAVVANNRILPELDQILASHILLHAAEGDLYEQALVEGASRAGLRAECVSPTSISIDPSLSAAGRIFGPSWRKDHKMAACAAFLVLGSAEP